MTNDDEQLELASKSWSRVINSAIQDGYRNGIEDGSESVHQTGFDTGYEQGIQIAFILGQYKGLLGHLTRNDNFECPTEIQDILNETRLGSCYICKHNLANRQYEKDEKEKSVAEIVECQKTHSRQIIKTLYDFFNPVMIDKKINIDHLVL